MNTSDYKALGERAVKCKRWRWVPGMKTLCGIRVMDGSHDWLSGHLPGPTTKGGGWVDTKSQGYFPDLSDSATVGGLTGLVRDVLRRPNLCCYPLPIRGLWYIDLDNSRFSASTEPESLIAALESAADRE